MSYNTKKPTRVEVLPPQGLTKEIYEDIRKAYLEHFTGAFSLEMRTVHRSVVFGIIINAMDENRTSLTNLVGSNNAHNITVYVLDTLLEEVSIVPNVVSPIQPFEA